MNLPDVYNGIIDGICIAAILFFVAALAAIIFLATQ